MAVIVAVVVAAVESVFVCGGVVFIGVGALDTVLMRHSVTGKYRSVVAGSPCVSAHLGIVDASSICGFIILGVVSPDWSPPARADPLLIG